MTFLSDLDLGMTLAIDLAESWHVLSIPMCVYLSVGDKCCSHVAEWEKLNKNRTEEYTNSDVYD